MTTVIGLQLGALISGAVITEQIFVIPGFGRLTIDAVNQRDYALLQGVVLVAAVGYVVVNLRRRPPLLGAQPADSRLGIVGMSYVDTTAVTINPRARRRRLLRKRFLRRPLAVVGLVVALLFILAAIFAPLVAPYSPSATDFNATLAPPFTSGHLLGTDELGRDVLSRIIWGARASIQAGVLATLLAIVIAVPDRDRRRATTAAGSTR